MTNNFMSAEFLPLYNPAKLC